MQNISTRAMFAEPTLIVAANESESESASQFTLDTTFVLFFLAMDLGQASLTLSFATALQLVTLVVFLVVPYFLPFTGDQQGFSRWIVGRIVVGAVGVTLGLMLGQAIGTVLPDAFRFVPMTLLIVAAIICCNVQIYGILKHRLAR
ncbi:MAG TPA: hypothetical protein PLK77_11745 [Pyrinomonadaceae bacterium]|nr:hypothetical protein [Pyrinomonadaceae bacterium]